MTFPEADRQKAAEELTSPDAEASVPSLHKDTRIPPLLMDFTSERTSAFGGRG